MTFYPIANGVEIDVLWTIAGSLCENRIYVRTPTTPNNAQLIDLSDLVETWVEEEYMPVCSDSVTATGLILTDKSVDGGIQIQTAFTHAGSATGGVTANEMSFCLKLVTGYSGRSRRGRWYMPPPATSQLSDANHLGVTAANAYKAALQALFDVLAASDYRAGVVSKVHNGVPVTSPIVLAYTTAVYHDLVLDSQRPRKPGYGT